MAQNGIITHTRNHHIVSWLISSLAAGSYPREYDGLIESGTGHRHRARWNSHASDND